jgi:hypothetical protein
MTLALTILLALSVAVGGAWIFLKTRGVLPLVARVLAGLAPLSAAAALYTIVFTVASSPVHDWNACKVAPVIAMVRGNPQPYPLYQDPETGVMTAWIYGPVPALMMLPAALASRPTSAIVLGVVINIVLVFAPAVWTVARHAGRSSGARVFAAAAVVLFGWRTLDHESLRRAVYMINIDGPTLGLATCALIVLFGRRNWLAYGISATCAVLACWSKQSALPLLLVAPVYLWLAEHWTAALRYALVSMLLGVVISTVMLMSFDVRHLWFHMVTLPASHPWQNDQSQVITDGHAGVMWRAVLRLVNDLLPTLGVLGAALLFGHYVVPRAARAGDWRVSLRAWMRDNPWTMLTLAAVFLLPASLLGYVKFGGYLNNFSLTHYFVALTAAVVLVQLYRSIENLPQTAGAAPSPNSHLPRFDARNLLVALTCTMLLWEWPPTLLSPRRFTKMYASIRDTWDNQQEAAFEFALKNPGKVYFPWNTLSTLLAEKRLYHFEWGVVDRVVAPVRFKPTLAHLNAHVPGGATAVAFGPHHQAERTLGFLPYFWEPVTLEGLKDFTAYRPVAPRPAGDIRNRQE